MAGFRRISETLSKPFSSHPNPYILPQQTTARATCSVDDPHGTMRHMNAYSEDLRKKIANIFDLGNQRFQFHKLRDQ
jgi:hypothetical protein